MQIASRLFFFDDSQSCRSSYQFPFSVLQITCVRSVRLGIFAIVAATLHEDERFCSRIAFAAMVARNEYEREQDARILIDRIFFLVLLLVEACADC